MENFNYDYYIDPEIKDIIIAINKLPFVKQTLYCCAGYGEHPQADINNGIKYKRKPIHSITPYFVLEYNPDPKWGDFHKCLLTKCTSKVGTLSNPNAYCYYLKDDGKTDNLKLMWNKIKRLVELF